MNISTKSNGDRIISRGQFTGGLNTITSPEMIADNQLAECVNMEFNKSTGSIQTCNGTATIFKAPDGVVITDLFYDKINNIFLIVDAERGLYASHLVDIAGSNSKDFVPIGKLSGNINPKSVMWEDGLLISSGGPLQYWNGDNLETIATDFSDELNMFSWDKIGDTVAKWKWSAKTDYSYGAIVEHESKYYLCNAEHESTDAFNSSLWDEITVHDEWEHDTEYTKTDVVKNGGSYYKCNEVHTSISKAPDTCNGVFVKNGRVWVWYEYRLHCSGVGDERNWTDISNDDSSSKWLDVGYKEGEKDNSYIAGVTALSSDIIVIKADGKIYRLADEYPNWALVEVARNINILSMDSYCAIQQGVFILSRNSLFYLQTTQNYGDIEPTNVAVNITNLFNDMSAETTKMRFIPSLNSIWITSRGNDVIVFDLTFNAFTQRRFNHRVVDIVSNYHDAVLLARSDKVTRLMGGVFIDELYSDDAMPVDWSFTAKSEISFNEMLLKRVRLSYVPYSQSFGEASVIMGAGRIKMPIPERRHIDQYITEDDSLVIDDNRLVFPADMQFNTSRMVYRNRTFDIRAEGKGAPIMLNRIDSDIVEV